MGRASSLQVWRSALRSRYVIRVTSCVPRHTSRHVATSATAYMSVERPTPNPNRTLTASPSPPPPPNFRLSPWVWAIPLPALLRVVRRLALPRCATLPPRVALARAMCRAVRPPASESPLIITHHNSRTQSWVVSRESWVVGRESWVVSRESWVTRYACTVRHARHVTYGRAEGGGADGERRERERERDEGQRAEGQRQNDERRANSVETGEGSSGRKGRGG